MTAVMIYVYISATLSLIMAIMTSPPSLLSLFRRFITGMLIIPYACFVIILMIVIMLCFTAYLWLVRLGRYFGG